MFTIGSLFSGIGGIELGLERTGRFRTVWQCEINDYARRVLAKHWPGVPIYQDVKELYETEFPEKVDVLCGGFPCQPFSTAGKRKGEADERFLWPEFMRIVREVRPRWVLAENVPGLLTIDSGRVFGRILRDLAECGYYVEWDTISAASVGALHPRNRIFIVGRLRDADRPSGQLPFGRVPFKSADARGDGQGQAVLANASSPGIGQEHNGVRRERAMPLEGWEAQLRDVLNTSSSVLANANGAMPGINTGAIQEAPGDIRRGAPSDLSSRCGQVLADPYDTGLEGRRTYRQGTNQRSVGSCGSVPNAPGEGGQCRQPGFGNDDRPHGRVGGNEQGGGDATLGQGHSKPDLGYGPLELGRSADRPGMFRDAIREWWAIEPDVGRVANGVPSRVDRLRCLGNAVVPQCAQYIGERIVEYERNQNIMG